VGGGQLGGYTLRFHWYFSSPIKWLGCQPNFPAGAASLPLRSFSPGVTPGHSQAEEDVYRLIFWVPKNIYFLFCQFI
jgi:hypothetical protein